MPRRFLLACFTVCALSLPITSATGQSFEAFIPEKICVADAVDKKLFMQAALGQKKCEGCTSEANIEKAANNNTVRLFLDRHEQTHPGSFKVLLVPHTPGGSVDYVEYVRTVDQRVKCLAGAAPLRTQLNAFAKSVGKAIQVRKDVDNFGTSTSTTDLSSAKPASFGFMKDWVAGNTLHSYEVAVGHVFEGALRPGQQMDLPFSLTPYARFVGQLNSDPKKKDVDNVGFGIRADVYRVPFGNILDNAFSLRAEYLTDSIAEASIAAGEFVWEPLPGADLDIRHPFGNAQPLFGLSGPNLRIDISGRVRFGHIFDPGLKPTVLTKESYVRIGGKAGATIGFGGYDIFSSLSFFATYLYFDTVEGLGGTFDKLEAGMNYQITENFGLTVKYVDGTDEDKLEPVQRFDAGFTVKF